MNYIHISFLILLKCLPALFLIYYIYYDKISPRSNEKEKLIQKEKPNVNNKLIPPITVKNNTLEYKLFNNQFHIWNTSSHFTQLYDILSFKKQYAVDSNAYLLSIILSNKIGNENNGSSNVDNIDNVDGEVNRDDYHRIDIIVDEDVSVISRENLYLLSWSNDSEIKVIYFNDCYALNYRNDDIEGEIHITFKEYI